jgi:hypothetical protein
VAQRRALGPCPASGLAGQHRLAIGAKLRGFADRYQPRGIRSPSFSFGPPDYERIAKGARTRTASFEVRLETSRLTHWRRNTGLQQTWPSRARIDRLSLGMGVPQFSGYRQPQRNSLAVSQNFHELPLHDAPVHELILHWPTGTLRIKLSVFLAKGRDATPAELVFSSVSRIDAPRENPWGPSVFVNSASFEPPNTYVIEMQSGDVIRVRAEAFDLTCC